MAAPMEADAFHPGAAPFGNFINYYSFNPPEKRINFLPSDLLSIISDMGRRRDVYLLDIGCNAGNLTVALYNHLTESQKRGVQQAGENCKPPTLPANEENIACPDISANRHSTSVHILGCDIDDALITRANEANSQPENITFKTTDFMCSATRHSAVVSFLPTRPATECRFDLICCFSITMWIHLQHGDKGLHAFLKEAAALSRFLLVEPQPWKCYKSAVRRVKRVGVETSWRFKELGIRETVEEDIQTYLTKECQMERVKTLGATHWDRKLLLFRNNQDAVE